MGGVTGLCSCGLAWQILCNPPTSPMALFTVRRVKLLWTQTKPALLSYILQLLQQVLHHCSPVLFFPFEGGQPRMFILPKSLLRLSSLDSGITAREPDKRDESHTEKCENKTFLRVFIPGRGRGWRGASGKSAVWMRDHSFLQTLRKLKIIMDFARRLQINTNACKRML